jgi:hypothetical protein
MHDKSDVHLPVELGPGPNTSVMVFWTLGLPALLWFASVLLGKRIPIQLLELWLGMDVFMVLYLKSMKIRLDEVGISQGFSVFRTFIPYETVSGSHREVRSGKGASTTVLVITKKDSAKRIVIYLRSIDQIKLAHMMAILARKAPQAHIQDALYIQFNP